MDQVLNKLRSTVSSTVSQLSGVLPGNPVTREYEATQLIASAGPGLLWKVYSGYKRSTKQEAAIFVFEKKQVEKWRSRRDRDAILEVLKRGVTQLTKLRHPQILTVEHPLEESRESLAFATEPVFGSLANALGDLGGIAAVPQLKNYQLLEVEIKYGLVQLSEGLAFLHNDVKLIHRNISPESIVINHQGAWKIFGLDFCAANQSPQDQKAFWSFSEYEPDLHSSCQPNLDFLAPEITTLQMNDTTSDMFSVGMLTYAVFNGGKPLFVHRGEWSDYKSSINELKHLSMSNLRCVPDGLREYVKMLLSTTPEVRPDAHQFSKVAYFDDVGVKTLTYLDSLFQWDNLQKSQFYKGLPQIIPKLPHRVCLHRILPCLFKEFVNPNMVPFVLPNVLLVAQDATKDDYIKYILPQLQPAMKIKDPIQVLLIFMQRMELLLQKTPPDIVKSHVLPMLYQALESEILQIQELCLVIIPSLAPLVDYPAMKNALLPRVKKLCMSTGHLSVRVNCLVCVGKLLEHLDKWLVLDEVLPLLLQIPSREPAVLMGILGIFKLCLRNSKLGISKEVLATKALPFLLPLSIENGLTLTQFNALIALIKDMINRVENEQRGKLEQINSIQQEQKSAFQIAMSAPSKPGELISAPPPQSELEDMFSGLGLSSFVEKNSNFEEVAGFKPAGSDAVSNGLEPNQSTMLSLEEKQRLSREQDNQQRHKVTSPLSPQASLPVSPPVSKTISQTPKTKDLTSTLINSNLNQMSQKRMPDYAAFGSFQSSSQPQQVFTPLGPPAGLPLRMGAFQPPRNIPPPFVNHQQQQPMAFHTPNMCTQPPMMIPSMLIPPRQDNIKPLSSNDIKDLLS